MTKGETTGDGTGHEMGALRHPGATDSERIASIKTRIRRSLDDPKPSLTDTEVEARLNSLFSADRS